MSGWISSTGWNINLAAPGPIGGTTPNTGAFTTLNASSNVTLSGGTANGVVYLDGSKNAASGASLVFDGANLGIGASSPYWKLSVSDGTVNGGMAPVSGNFYLGTKSNHPILFRINDVDLMTLDTSGNFGIATTTPGAKLSAIISSTGTVAQFNTDNTAVNSTAIAIGGYQTGFDATTGTHIRALTNHGATTNSSLAFEVSGTNEAMRIDSNGNILINTTTSPSGSQTSGNVIANGVVSTAGYTVATLPTGMPTGSRAYVTDALTPVVLTTVAGGGAVVVPVFYDGSNWIVG